MLREYYTRKITDKILDVLPDLDKFRDLTRLYFGIDPEPLEEHSDMESLIESAELELYFIKRKFIEQVEEREGYIPPKVYSVIKWYVRHHEVDLKIDIDTVAEQTIDICKEMNIPYYSYNYYIDWKRFAEWKVIDVVELIIKKGYSNARLGLEIMRNYPQSNIAKQSIILFPFDIVKERRYIDYGLKLLSEYLLTGLRLSEDNVKWIFTHSPYYWESILEIMYRYDDNWMDIAEKLVSEPETVVKMDPHTVNTEGMRYILWKRLFGRVPKNQQVFKTIDCGDIVWFAENKRAFRIFLKKVKEYNKWRHSSHWIKALANLIRCWGSRVLQIADDKIHDLGINMIPPYSKEVSDWLWKHRRSRRFNDYVRVANNYERLVEQGHSLNEPIDTLLGVLATINYDPIISPEFAAECGKWGIDPDDFREWQERWVNGLKNLKYESIPRVDFTYGDYRFYRLRKDDPRGVFLGLYTDCCQWPGGAGKTCAWYGHESGDSAFVVVEYRGQVIAQSWVWRYGNVIVFDNIEVLGREEKRAQTVLKLYKMAAEKFLGRFGITEVRVGCGFSDVDLDEFYDVDPIQTPEGIYTDAKIQKIIAKI